MTVSTSRVTGGSDIIEKAWDLLELLSATCVPAPMAKKVLEGSLHYVFIKTGNEDGGLCSKYGIKEEQFVQLRQRLENCLKKLAGSRCMLLKEGGHIYCRGDLTQKIKLDKD